MRLLPSLVTLLCLSLPPLALAAERPNVVLIITDDQGYGDLGCHGNRMIQTPSLDRLYKQSVRLTNFHSDPTCAETRAALMTGRYSCRAGVWHTVAGRSILRQDEVTMPELFRAAGYRTAHFGKWHLGDHYPYRPHDRGFDETLYHGCGGVTQINDAWGNDYFDDTYFRNGRPEKQTGYCTDVWFAEATKFIEKNRKRPFLCYIATNAPHDPFLVEEKYSQPYLEQGVPPAMARFYGMITNIDENVGRLLQQLDEWQLSDNTLVIYMTDNGTSAGAGVRREDQQAGHRWNGFTAGMRAQKGSQYDGGHRVPCFLRWPQGEIGGGRDAKPITAHFDLLPTLIDLCQLQLPQDVRFDGRSLRPLLLDQADDWPQRTLVVHSQRMEHPQPWHKTAVMTDRWRLVDGKELYDMPNDPGQTQNVAAEHADLIADLKAFYDDWWRDVSERFDEYVRIPLGDENAPLVLLTCHDWHGQAIAYQSGLKGNPAANGWWAVEIARPGKYRITLRDRPRGVDQPLTATTAHIQFDDAGLTAVVQPGAEEVFVEWDLKAGPAKLQTFLTDADGKTRGAYFVYVERL